MKKIDKRRMSKKTEFTFFRKSENYILGHFQEYKKSACFKAKYKPEVVQNLHCGHE